MRRKTRPSVNMSLLLSCMCFLLAGAPGCKDDKSSSGGESSCTDRVDNDDDGLTDCQDDDCAGRAECQSEQNCIDGYDDDNDGLTDCQDDDCASNPTCQATEDCENGVDDNLNGYTDCDDPDCADFPACITETNCDNDIDDDEDGLTDCVDMDCAGDPACTGPNPCNNDNNCDAGENCLWCPDCCAVCALDQGDNYDYIVNELILPMNAQEAANMGVDLDGDGDIDNKLGSIIGALPFEPGDGPNEGIAYYIAQQRFIVLARLVVDTWPTDTGIAIQLLSGDTDPTHDATADNLTGNGHALIADDADRNNHLCGTLNQGYLDGGPGSLLLPVLLFDTLFHLPVERAMVMTEDPVSETGLMDVMIGGGLTTNTIENVLYPVLVSSLNDWTIALPTGDVAAFVLNSLDAACDNGIPGCESVVPGVGECEAWDNDPNNPPLTITEIRCNAFVDTAFAPDLDINFDGVPDLLTVGMLASAIPITIDN